ncbi:MAG: hypothetical protein ABIU63_14680 [Chitinophagaceae bacterium]
MKKVAIIALYSFFTAQLVAQVKITAAEAAKHIDEKVTVCDKVFGARFLENATRQPTLVNMGDAYPNNPFTFVIFGEDRKKFKYVPEDFLVDKQVCVTGEITLHKDKPQIVVSDTAQVTVEK